MPPGVGGGTNKNGVSQTPMDDPGNPAYSSCTPMEIVDPRISPDLVPPGSSAVIFAKDQPQYNPLPSIRTPNGQVITRWALTDAEKRKIIEGEDLFLTILTYNQPLQPVLITVGPIDWSV